MSSQKQIHENWNKFLKERPSTTLPGHKQIQGSGFAKLEPEEDPRVMGPDKQADAPAALAWWKTLPEPQKSDLHKSGEAAMINAWREAGKPEAGGEEAAEEPSKIIAGINSLSYPDSLLNMLKNVELTGPQKRQLLSLMLKATEQDDIVLEAIGDAQRDPRTFSPKTSERLNDLIDSFNLKPKAKNNLEKVLNKWAKMNTVKFSKAPSYGTALSPDELPPEAPMDDEDTSDEPTVTGRAVSPEAPMDDEDTADEPTVTGQPETAPQSQPDEIEMDGVRYSSVAGQAWDSVNSKWIENPTPEDAINAIMREMGNWRAGEDVKYKDARKQLEYLEALVKRGGGLSIEDTATGDKDIIPKWVPTRSDDPRAAGSYELYPDNNYTYALYTPFSMENFFKQMRANVPKILDPFGARAGMKLSKNVSPRSQEFLKMFVKEFKRVFQSRRKPEDPKNLEESFDRLQTLAGINKRIL